MRLFLLFLVSLGLFGANFKLYMKDGNYHRVSEYQIQGDRVRYFSTERTDWEEIPLELIDIKRTENERKSENEQRAADAAAQDEEDQAERILAKEISKIPLDPGVYLAEENSIRTLAQADTKFVTDKKRSILKAMSPIPIVNGKATIEVDGDKSKTVIRESRPEFYLRQSSYPKFALVRLEQKNSSRIVEKVVIVPIEKIMLEEQDQVEIFRRQLSEGLFKIWPIDKLPMGDYAVIQFTGNGEANPQVWDFRIE